MIDWNPAANAIFAQAVEQPAERQSTFVREACGDDAELLGIVERLLAAHSAAGSVLEGRTIAPTDQVAVDPQQTMDQKSSAAVPAFAHAIGDRIGRYKLLQQIGEGGMGAVWMAEQIESVRRKVALKVIKPGMDSAQVLGRFEAERQALALMDHPSIAKVLDAGTTDRGLPYFVMELVKGMPITKYCDEHRLTPRQRLELFIPVCQAIQHAHQKGIIHRDIKPTNVLVASYDGKPVPKVIDFGVAKAVGQQLTDRTLFTGFGIIVGTLEYMSPEQAEFNSLDVDTRSDVFSLGVLLYELLTGTTPLTRQRLKEAGLTEVLRLIREEEPPKPSTRLSDSKDSLATVSALRKLEPSRLTNQIRGELDWIVMKSLEKDRLRRYQAAIGLAHDIQRYLSDEAVEACPPSASYRLKKVMRKHRVALSTAAAFALLLVTASAVSVWLAIRAGHAEKQAKLDRDEAIAARTLAEEQTQLTQETNDFLARDLLGQGDLAESAGGEQGTNPDMKVRELLDRATERIDGKLAKQPKIEAQIRRTIGSAYRALGEVDKALLHLERARDLCLGAAEFGPENSATLFCLGELGSLYYDMRRYAEAEKIHESVLQVTLKLFADNHKKVSVAQQDLALVYIARSNYSKAEPLLISACASDREHLGDAHADTCVSKNNLALLYLYTKRPQEAEQLLRELLVPSEQTLGPNHPRNLAARLNLASALRQQKKFAAAEEMSLQVMAQYLEVRGAHHMSTFNCQRQLANLYLEMKQPAKAESLFREAIAGYAARIGVDARVVHILRREFATCLIALRKFEEAVPLLQSLLDESTQRYGPEAVDTLITKSDLAGAYRDSNSFVESERLFREVWETRLRLLGPKHSFTTTAQHHLGIVLRELGRYSDAEPMLRESYREARADLGIKDSLVRTWLGDLIHCLHHMKQGTTAEPLCREMIEQSKVNPGADSVEHASALALLGANLLLQNKSIEAEPVLRDCLAIRQKKSPDLWSTFNTQAQLGAAILGQALAIREADPDAAKDKLAIAENLLLDGYRGMKDRVAKSSSVKLRLQDAAGYLAKLYEATGRAEQAKAILAESQAP